MTNYREILRLKSLGYTQRSIASGAKVSRNTVSEVLKKAEQLKMGCHKKLDKILRENLCKATKRELGRFFAALNLYPTGGIPSSLSLIALCIVPVDIRVQLG